MTQAIPSASNLPFEVKIIQCDLCNHEFSYDSNLADVTNTASAKCPRCSYNQTTISKPRVSDLVAFGAPIAFVYIATIAVLLLNR